MPDQKQVRRAADLCMNYPYKVWFYGDSVGFEGLLEASSILDDRSYHSFVTGMGRGALARDSQPREYDNTIPGRALVVAAQRAGDDDLLAALGDVADWLEARPTLRNVPISLSSAALLEPYGGEALPADEGDLLDDPGPAVYVDCMHFDTPFMSALGRATEDDERVDRSAALALDYCELLQQSSGLFHHFYLGKTERAYIQAWSRGQGWALLGLVDTVESIGLDHPAAPSLVTRLELLVSGMSTLQRTDGHWHAVADAPASSVEASTAAFFAAGLLKAIRLRILSDEWLPVARAAAQATVSTVDETGKLRDVSAVVWSSTRSSHYEHVSIDHTVPWGQGPLLLTYGELCHDDSRLSGEEF